MEMGGVLCAADITCMFVCVCLCMHMCVHVSVREYSMCESGCGAGMGSSVVNRNGDRRLRWAVTCNNNSRAYVG